MLCPSPPRRSMEFFVLPLKYLMSFPPPPRRSMFALAAGANNRPLAPRPQLLLFASQKYGLSPCSSFAALSHGSLIFAPRSQRSCVFFVLSLLCLMSFPPPRLRHSSPTRNRVHSSAKCANSLFPLLKTSSPHPRPSGSRIKPMLSRGRRRGSPQGKRASPFKLTPPCYCRILRRAAPCAAG